MSDSSERYTGTSGAARALKISESAVRDLERRGVLPAERTSTGQRLFKAEDVDRVGRARMAERPEQKS